MAETKKDERREKEISLRVELLKQNAKRKGIKKEIARILTTKFEGGEKK